MKLIPFLTASLLLCSSAFAQIIIPPPNGGFYVDDPVIASVNKTKSYAKTYGFSQANLKVGMSAYGTVLAVQDETQVLARATTGAKVEGLAQLLYSSLLGATARFDADAANATWSYSGGVANVTSQTDNAKATCFVKVGPYTLLNETKAFSGDISSSPSFFRNYTKHIFDVHITYNIVLGIDFTVYIGADAGAALSFTGTLDPLVVSGNSVGSKAKMVGAANGWVTGYAGFQVGNFCVHGNLQLDLELANSGFNGVVTAERNAVTGTVSFTEQPLALKLRALWGGWCIPDGGTTLWSWASVIYAVNYVL
ncbi:MAG TPA: hypothetical protein VK843_17350 [Planctomycetota bacterium]|nr:hypothetical protein [Planctomycetota bacterium]